MRLAICFYGIPRSERWTSESIKKNIITPARKCCEVRVFAHFFNQREIKNPRSGEFGALEILNPKILEIDDLVLEEPRGRHEDIDNQINYVRKFGDYWSDGYRSFSNLIHQLHSIKSVYNMSKKHSSDITVFIRPDLFYHDSFERLIRVKSNGSTDVILPNWQHWQNGYNDRFSVCYTTKGSDAWANRIDLIREFCDDEDAPLHAERLLKFAMNKNNVRMAFTSIRATRVRSNGYYVNEDFRNFKAQRALNFVRRFVTKSK